MKSDPIAAVGQTDSITFSSFHDDVKAVEEKVLSGTPVFLHKEGETRGGIIMVDFDTFYLLLVSHLNYIDTLKEKLIHQPIILS
ncbi:MAG: hypothetical protein J6328_01945 [Bacilli bacterium]|nr:hypothetical protein [Bacilli bacterium]